MSGFEIKEFDRLFLDGKGFEVKLYEIMGRSVVRDKLMILKWRIK